MSSFSQVLIKVCECQPKLPKTYKIRRMLEVSISTEALWKALCAFDSPFLLDAEICPPIVIDFENEKSNTLSSTSSTNSTTNKNSLQFDEIIVLRPLAGSFELRASVKCHYLQPLLLSSLVFAIW